tara:strand:+ start:6397 stop:7101 length:705 start_codon:yes stop_codon:yes gene_type:complete
MIKENKSILIIGTQRSGTNSLSFALHKHVNGGQMNGVNSTREPWNYNSPFVRGNDTSIDWTKTPYNLDLIGTSNVVIKTQSFQKPKHFPGSSVEFMEQLAKRFNKNRIIILCRKDYDKHIISYTNLRYKVYMHGYWTGLAQKTWEFSEIPQEYLNNKEEQAIIRKHVTEQRQLISEISDKLNIGVSWHEDLFGTDRQVSLGLIQSWNLGLDADKVNRDLHPRHKLDKTHTKSNI